MEDCNFLTNKIKNMDIVVENTSSPCVRICKLEKNICIACKRSMKQIKEWMDYSEEKRIKIIKNLKQESIDKGVSNAIFLRI